MATANTNFDFDEGSTKSDHNNGSWEESTAAAASFATAAFAAGTGLPLNNNQDETDMAVGEKKPQGCQEKKGGREDEFVTRLLINSVTILQLVHGIVIKA